MSKTEDAILARLSVTPGETVPTIELERLLYGERESQPTGNCVQVFIHRLRKRGHTIKNRKGQGYRLVKDES